MDVSPKPTTVRGSAETFTGHVWIDPITRDGGSPNAVVSAVRFAPGARSAWHSHPGGQTLHVTDGRGLAQVRGQHAVTLHAGDVVVTPAGEEHWHGATPDDFMSHLSITTEAPRWGAHVSDGEYRDAAAPLEVDRQPSAATSPHDEGAA